MRWQRLILQFLFRRGYFQAMPIGSELPLTEL